MESILQSLGINQTIFIQLGLFVAIYLILTRVYFKPFMKLIELREQRTKEDKESAKKLLIEAEEKFAEYQALIRKAKEEAHAVFDDVVSKAKSKEREILEQSKNEVKNINQEALSELNNKKAEIKKNLEKEVSGLAQLLADKLLMKG